VQTNPGEIVRLHIWVKGRVQGVGFRAHVEYYASSIGVSGWVRNVGWDTVEAVAEGSREQVGRFIERVKSGPAASRVDDALVEEEPIEGLQGFSVRSSR
jgi:acylphosphatase